MSLSEKLISRYRELKQEALDCILLMQVGVLMKVLDAHTGNRTSQPFGEKA